MTDLARMTVIQRRAAALIGIVTIGMLLLLIGIPIAAIVLNWGAGIMFARLFGVLIGFGTVTVVLFIYLIGTTGVIKDLEAKDARRD